MTTTMTPLEELLQSWDDAASESHKLTDAVGDGSVIVSKVSMDRLQQALESATGIQAGILANYRGPRSTGSADGMIEPKPADGRRLEKRVAELEHRLEKHSKLVADVNNGYGGIRDQLTYLRKSHDALTETVEQQGRELAELGRLRESGCELWGGLNNGIRANLAALTERVNLLEDDAEARADQVHILLNPERDEAPTQSDQPYAEMSDAQKWQHGLDEETLAWSAQPTDADGEDTYGWGVNMLGGIGFYRNGVVVHVATREQLVKVGLAAKPIDPTDERLVNVVVYSVGGLMRAPDGYDKAWTARRILTAIAAAQQEGAK